MNKSSPTLDLDAFRSYANIIKNQHNEMLEARKSYIKAMYRILMENAYTRQAAIDTIYTTLANKLNSMIEVRKSYIEEITKEIKQ